MLLNLTNHPSHQWPENQTALALKSYQNVIDLPFPQIAPSLTSAQLDELVGNYFQKVTELHPNAVHIMGEMTFTFRLVQMLKAFGIPCIASTTERVTEQVGEMKTSKFQFVQFRAY